MLEVFTKAKEVLFRPNKFFRNLKEKGARSAFSYFLVIGFVGIAINSLRSIVLGSHIGVIIFAAIVAYLIGIFLFLFTAGVYHVLAKIFGGKGVFAKSYQVRVYAATGFLLFSQLPFISIVFRIYSLVLLVIAGEEIHKLGRIKSILVVVLFVVIIDFPLLYLSFKTVPNFSLVNYILRLR